MEGLLQDVFNHHIAPYLDGRDASRLACACKQTKRLVYANQYLTRRRMTHYIELTDIKQLQDEVGTYLAIKSHVMHVFKGHEHYWGEATSIVTNEHGDILCVNNHYDIDMFMGHNWVHLSKECPFPFWLIAFPTLSGTKRFSIGEKTFHRGFCAKILLQKGNRGAVSVMSEQMRLQNIANTLVDYPENAHVPPWIIQKIREIVEPYQNNNNDEESNLPLQPYSPSISPYSSISSEEEEKDEITPASITTARKRNRSESN